MTSNTSNQNRWLGHGLYLLIMAVVVSGIYLSGQRINYSWHWERLWPYIINTTPQDILATADGVLQVANGQADAFIYDLPYNALYASQHKDKVVHLSKSFTYEPLGWAIRRGDADFINFLNNYLKMIKNDGTYDRLYAKWFESDAWVKQVQ